MKQNGRIARLLVSTALALSMTLVVSCAHTGEMSAEEEAMMKGQPVAAESTEGASGEVAESQKVEDKAFERVADTAEAKTEESAPSKEESATEKTDAPIMLDAGTPEAAVTPASEESVASETPAPAASEETASTEPTLVSPPTDSASAASTDMTTASLAPTESSASYQPDASASVETEKAPVKKARRNHKKKTATKAKQPTVEAVAAPEIPVAAFTKDGRNMNRFYFVRVGDASEKVSQILYGNADKAKDLLAWNGGATSWQPGEAIFYVSPVRPQDTQMLSYYQEAAITPHHYMVKEGEDIFKIALDVYGDKRSWKEIAIVNGMKAAGKVQPGTELLLLPAKLTGHSTTVEAKAAPVTTQASASAQPGTKPDAIATNTAASQPVAMGAAKPAETVSKTSLDSALADEDELLVPGKDMKSQPKAKLASMDMGQFLMNNIFLVMTGLLCGAILLFALVRRAKGSREPVDF